MALSNFYWDASEPVNGTLIPDGPQAWRYVIGNVETLFGSEHHTFPDDSNVGAYHQPGSAVLLTGTTRPTQRLDTSAFDINDNGRLFYDSDTETIEVLTAFGGPTWVNFGSLSAAHTWAAVQTFSEIPLATKGIAANNTFIAVRNAADDGNVDLIKADGSDVVTLVNDVVTNTQSASDNSTKLATTAYADTQVATRAFGEFTTDDDTPTAMLVDHAYLANQDGTVTVNMISTESGSTFISGYIGTTTDPAGAGTLIVWSGTFDNGGVASITFPVASGKYFEITSNKTPTINILWHPIGVLVKPTDQD